MLSNPLQNLARGANRFDLNLIRRKHPERKQGEKAAVDGGIDVVAVIVDPKCQHACKIGRDQDDISEGATLPSSSDELPGTAAGGPYRQTIRQNSRMPLTPRTQPRL